MQIRVTQDYQDIVVSDILIETNTILYNADTCTSIFYEANVTATPESNCTLTSENKVSGSDTKMAANVNMYDEEWKRYLKGDNLRCKKCFNRRVSTTYLLGTNLALPSHIHLVRT